MLTRSLFTLLFASALAACGGGGGGGGSAQVFSSWSEIAPNKTLRLTGISLNRDYTLQASDNAVMEFSPLNTEDSTFSISYDSQPDIASIQLTTGSKTQTFSTSAGDGFANLGPIFGSKWYKISFAVDQAGQDFGIALNSIYPGVDWSYQTYGAWLTSTGTGSGYMASTSVGNQTLSSSIPASGTAVFNGFSSGFAVLPYGTARSIIVNSDFQATADFGSREVSFAASNSEAAFLDSLGTIIDGGEAFDYSGTLTYNSGNNLLVGSLNTFEQIDSIVGTVTAQFYGPNAEELGGVFDVSFPRGFNSYSGAFGAKR
jgi:hypothetical protein